MVLEPGSRLGPYEIVAPLGAGGMGEAAGRVTTASGARSPSRSSPRPSQRIPNASPVSIGGPCPRRPQPPQHPRRSRRRLAGPIAYIVAELLEGGTLRGLLGQRRCAAARQSGTRCRSPAASPLPTRRGSCTGISSRGTSSSQRTARSRSSISAWPRSSASHRPTAP